VRAWPWRWISGRVVVLMQRAVHCPLPLLRRAEEERHHHRAEPGAQSYADGRLRAARIAIWSLPADQCRGRLPRTGTFRFPRANGNAEPPGSARVGLYGIWAMARALESAASHGRLEVWRGSSACSGRQRTGHSVVREEGTDHLGLTAAGFLGPDYKVPAMPGSAGDLAPPPRTLACCRAPRDERGARWSMGAGSPVTAMFHELTKARS